MCCNAASCGELGVAERTGHISTAVNFGVEMLQAGLSAPMFS
jgi:hypothetical protein